MLSALGVMLVLAGVSAMLIGLIRNIFPKLNNYVPADMKKWLSLRYGVYCLLAGLLLLSI